MKILTLSILIILPICIIVLCLLLYRMHRTSKFNERQILKTLRQLRYGQLNVDLSGFKNAKIQSAASKLTEALKDRETMLEEYKHILIEKNKSLETMIELEKESQKFKDDFVAALAHDLKTPVIAEVNTIEMILRGTFGEVTEAQKKVFEMMLQSDKDLIHLSEMLLQTYKFQEGKIEIKPEKTDYSAFLSNITEEMFPVFKAKGQILTTDKIPTFIVNIDKIQFKRVIENLLINANKYGDENSEIFIRVYNEESNVIFEISNTGQVISEKDIELIFQKYYSGTNKFTHLGTGLGLYCANKIVQLHNGTITAETENNKTTFRVSLPVCN